MAAAVVRGGRQLLGTLLLVVLLGLVATNCGPEPVGVDDCRAIESARCEAAVACGLVDDAESCSRFYRDQCLHGLAAPDSPGAPQVDACVKAISTVGKCAEQDPAQALETCDDTKGVTLLPDADPDNVCTIVERPELTQQCEFLSLEPEGAGGAGGDSGG